MASSANPSDFQRRVFNLLAILGLSQVTIRRDRNGGFTLHTSSFPRRILYFILRINTALKLTFLVLLSGGFFPAKITDFFDFMAVALWFLIFLLMCTSERLWYRKHPFFEILTAWWKLEERIYESLKRPDRFIKDLRFIGWSRVLFQSFVAIIGILAVAVQYDAEPKYCVFAFSIIDSEDPILKWVFGAHEVIFLTHAWLVYGSVIYISSALGAEFTYTIEVLHEVLQTFEDNRRRVVGPRASSVKRKRFSRGSSLLAESTPLISEIRIIELAHRIRNLDNPLLVVKEYIHVHTLVTQLNYFAAYNFLYMHACSYIQMVSDVYQLIIILRMPDSSLTDAMFFAEDMFVCCYLLFRCFKSMAFLHPASTTFIDKYRELMSAPVNMPRMDRQVLAKTLRIVRPIAFKLGPISMRIAFVGMAMDTLIQYYICVALWK